LEAAFGRTKTHCLKPKAVAARAKSHNLDTAILDRIQKLSKGEYAVFLELGQGWEIDEIAERLKKDVNAIYALVYRIRLKLGIKTIAMLRCVATQHVMSETTAGASARLSNESRGWRVK
jgi:DNA-binding NarL/FixJ family response regulator